MGSFQMSDAYIWHYNENDRERRPGLPTLEIGDQNRALLIPGEVYCRFSKDGGNTLCPETGRMTHDTLKIHLRTDHRLNIAEPAHSIRLYCVDQAIGAFYAKWKKRATGEVGKVIAIPLDRFGNFDISRMKQNAGLKPEDACNSSRW